MALKNAFDKLALDSTFSPDAFGRLRISEPVTIFDSQLQYDNQPLLWEEKISGSANCVHLPNESSSQMNVSTADGDSVIRQTYDYFRYQPGKSQRILLTGVFGSPQANTEKYIGYGDAKNGIFMGQDNTGMFVLLRSNITGTPSDSRKIYQSNWNLDTLDGSGPSGLTMDPTKSIIIDIDMEWLGVGRVRIGSNINGVTYYVHEFLNANVYDSVYMTTANLPCRYEIKNVGTAPSSSSMKHICSQVMSEGGVEDTLAYPFSTTLTGVSIGNGIGNENLVFSARHRLLFKGIENRAKFRPVGFDIAPETNNDITFRIIYNPTITGGSWVDVDTNQSIMEYNNTSTSFSGGLNILTGHVFGGTGQNAARPLSKNISSRLPFGLNIDGDTAIPLSLAAYADGAGATATLTVAWEELR